MKRKCKYSWYYYGINGYGDGKSECGYVVPIFVAFFGHYKYCPKCGKRIGKGKVYHLPLKGRPND